MKKYLLLIVSFLIALSSTAQMKIIDNTFRDFASGNVAAGGSSLGKEDLTANSIYWGTDANGEDGKETMSCLYITFRNMAPEDIDKLGLSVDAPSMIVRSISKDIKGLPTLEVFFESGNNLGINLTHRNTNIGEVRIPVHDYLPGHVYGVEIQNPGLVSVPVTSEPAGATVYFDGQDVGKTPLTINSVSMGKHNIALSPADPKIANPIQEHIVYVNSDQRAFNFPMFKTKDVTIVAKPSNSYITVNYNGQTVASGLGEVDLPNARYDATYKIHCQSGTDETDVDLQISEFTPAKYNINVIGSKNISFTAKQNNAEVYGAELLINGVPVGYTPHTEYMEYGKYEVSASYNGYTKSEKVTINKNKNTVLLKIPNRKHVGFNPFDVDFSKRQWGITAAYIHRFFNYKKDGKSTHYNWVGEEGGSNGIQVGISYQPYFGYGQGLATGIFWQGTFGSTDFNNGYSVEKVSYTESALYVPLQYQFRLPLHTNFSVAVNAGMAITYGIENKFSEDLLDSKESYDIGYGYNSQYDVYSPDKFDYSFLIGFAIQFKAVQLEGKYSLGLKNHKIAETFDDSGSISYKSSFLSAGISLLF